MKRKTIISVSLVILLLISAACLFTYRWAMVPYEYETTRINIPHDATTRDIKELLIDALGREYGNRVYNLWRLRKGTTMRARGSYKIEPGEKAFTFANRLRSGLQNPVKVVVRPRRSVGEVADDIARQMDFSNSDFLTALASACDTRKIDSPCRISVIIPDTYEFYWTSSAQKVVEKMLQQYDRTWNQDRKAKAKKLNLTPCEVATLASIVEEETAKTDERPIVARLYLNRLDRGMRLQADPTVKYAVGDPSLKRILNKHLATHSPYNTYLNDGLPPGPIRIVEVSTIDAVLNAPEHNYIYMCAKEDFSGYHNFATTLSAHNDNARRYHKKLSELKL